MANLPLLARNVPGLSDKTDPYGQHSRHSYLELPLNEVPVAIGARVGHVKLEIEPGHHRRH